MRSTAYVPARPRYGLADIIGLLFREFWIMVLVFIIVAAIGAAAVMMVKKTYVASADLYAGAGQEYAYEPRVGALTERQSQAPAPGEVAVTEVIDRWLDPEHRYFKVRGEDGGIYLIRQDTRSDRWELTLFDSGHREETRLSST